MDDIRTRLIGRSIYWSDKEDTVLAWEAARAITDLWLEIERLRREATAFTVGPDEVLVVVLPDATTPDSIEWLRERFPSVVRDRVVFIAKQEARRG